jgi:hypothetical protein
MPHSIFTIRAAVTAAGILVGSTVVAGAQSARPAAPAKHAPICAKGVKVYTDRSQIPVPFDTLEVPPADGPVRVTNEQEAEAAELAMRGRAGSVGATGVLVTDDSQDDADGNRRVRRSVTGIFVPADTARARQACK